MGEHSLPGGEGDLGSFDALERIVARLRSPQGCPWDREQTHASLKRFLLEEAYETLETLEALDAGEPSRLCEELGDLLLQILLHAQIASEAGEFEMRDVIEKIARKLLHRHPHVFGALAVSDAEEVERNWEVLKGEEREEGLPSLASLPRAMPALAYAQRIQERAARAGFDWSQVEGVLEKLREELGELGRARDKEEQQRELGDLLFSVVNLARWLGLDAEEGLRLTNQRFFRRFSYMEGLCRERGLTLENLDPEQQDQLWEEAKGAIDDA